MDNFTGNHRAKSNFQHIQPQNAVEDDSKNRDWTMQLKQHKTYLFEFYKSSILINCEEGITILINLDKWINNTSREAIFKN